MAHSNLLKGAAMNPADYVKNALRTESDPHQVNLGNPLGISKIRLLHATMGLCTESGELTDQLKKHLFYGTELDRVNLIEEAGDLLWYLAILLNELETGFDEVMSSNIAKLRSRYPEKFTNKNATTRDTAHERETLEMEIEINEKNNNGMADEKGCV